MSAADDATLVRQSFPRDVLQNAAFWLPERPTEADVTDAMFFCLDNAIALITPEIIGALRRQLLHNKELA